MFKVCTHFMVVSGRLCKRVAGLTCSLQLANSVVTLCGPHGVGFDASMATNQNALFLIC